MDRVSTVDSQRITRCRPSSPQVGVRVIGQAATVPRRGCPATLAPPGSLSRYTSVRPSDEAGRLIADAGRLRPGLPRHHRACATSQLKVPLTGSESPAGCTRWDSGLVDTGETAGRRRPATIHLRGALDRASSLDRVTSAIGDKAVDDEDADRDVGQ